LKYNKIYYSCKILELLSEGLNKENMNEIIMLSYHVRQESDNITLEEYVEKVKQNRRPPRSVGGGIFII